MSLFNRFCAHTEQGKNVAKNFENLVSDFIEDLPKSDLPEAEAILVSTLTLLFSERRMREGNLERRKEIGY